MNNNNFFWELLAYTAGTGGSILIIGSAAGIALMAINKISFPAYAKTTTPKALLSDCGGVAIYFLFA